MERFDELVTDRAVRLAEVNLSDLQPAPVGTGAGVAGRRLLAAYENLSAPRGFER